MLLCLAAAVNRELAYDFSSQAFLKNHGINRVLLIAPELLGSYRVHHEQFKVLYYQTI